MEQVFDSEESNSGCESGWTLYLQHSNIIPHHHDFSCKKVLQHDQEIDHEHDDGDEDDDNDDDDDDDDDDMSMVSDASSGPPHFQEHEYCNDNNNNNNGVFSCNPTSMLGSRKRRKIFKQTSFHSHRHIMQDSPDSIDDTASSPFFSFSNKDLKVCNKTLLEDEDDSFSYSQGHSTTYFEMV